MAEYPINKGVGRQVEFKGLRAQYLFLFAGGLLAVFILVVVLYMGGVDQVACLVAGVGLGGALVAPRKDALIQLNINPHERARINALIMAFTIAFSSPFGYFTGWLSSMDRRLPFVFTFILFVTAMVIVGRIREPELDQETAES